jgi:hypothetical protein
VRTWQTIRSATLLRHSHQQSYAALVLSGAYEEAQIETLQRLAHINDSGIIMGQVIEPIWKDNKWETSIPLTDHKVIAKEQANSREYVAFTDNVTQ